ncbi:MAG: hypothetical protein AAGG53_09855 [Cyanobacteria bacterium P01_H01_bin.152]
MERQGLRSLILDELNLNDRLAQRHGFFYNTGIVIILVCTGASTVLGGLQGSYPIPLWVVPVLSAIASLVVGVDRSLQLGARWIHHRHLKASYESLRIRLMTLDYIDGEKQADEINKIRAELVGLPKEWVELPGSEGISGDISGGT